MKAKMTLLTHFSQRYAKMPYLAEIEDQPNVGVVFDNMTISRDKQNIIPSVYPALKRYAVCLFHYPIIHMFLNSTVSSSQFFLGFLRSIY